MNKNDYIREVSSIKPSENLKWEILNMKPKSINKKTATWKIVVSLAACLIFVVGIVPALLGSNFAAKSESVKTVRNEENEAYSYNENYSQEVDGEPIKETALTGTAQESRKIVKNAKVYIETKDLAKLLTQLNEKIAEYEGYTDSLDESMYDSKSANLVAKIPAQKLDSFISVLEELGTVKSKNISNTDITDAYTDVESNIEALEIEEKTLLDILSKCDNMNDVIQVQNRLSDVRAELNSYKTSQKRYDSQISYSAVAISISEEERIVERNDGSFSARLKERFSDSLYNIGAFFEEVAVNLLGGVLYIAIFAVVAVAVVIIVKKVKKKKGK